MTLSGLHTRSASIVIWTAAALLAVNAMRITGWLPRLFSSGVAAAQPLPSAVIPYTVLIRETSTLPDGTTALGARITKAMRSDGATVDMLDYAGSMKQISQRHIVYASGEFASTDEIRQIVAFSAIAKNAPMARHRDPATRCLNMFGGRAANVNERALRDEFVEQYRTVVISNGRATRWLALDLGCAPLRSEHVFESGELNRQEAITILPGEPDAALFEVPTWFARVSAGELFNRPDMDELTETATVPSKG